jgi:hypothetical protein
LTQIKFISVVTKNLSFWAEYRNVTGAEGRSLANKFRERWPGQLADELSEIVEVLENSTP